MRTNPSASPVFSLPGFSLLLALAIFACFPDVLLGRSSFFFRDYGVLGYPVVHHFRESLGGGEFPLWNPLSNCGVPFFAQWGVMGAYPPSLIFLLLPLPWSLSFFCLLHLWLGGVGMYLLARHWTANDAGAAFAGSAYTFNGILFASFIWPNYFVALAWAPFVLWLAERAWREGGRMVPLAALVSALQLGAGVPEIVIFTWLVAGAIWVADLADVPGNASRMLLRTLGVVVLAAGLMAVQLLPFLELLRLSQRDVEFATGKWSLPVWASANLIAPLLNCFETPQGQYFQYGQEFMSSVYLGAPLVTLALIGILKFPVLRTWLLVVLSVIAVLLAFGDNGPLYPLIRGAIPIAGIARYPVKFLFILAFTLPLLAAQAVRALHVEREHGYRSLAYACALMVLALGALTWAARQGMLADMSAWPENFRQNALMSWKDAATNAAIRGAILIGTVVALVMTLKARTMAMLGGFLLVALLAIDARTHAPNQNPTLPAAEFLGKAWDSAVAPQPVHGEGRVFITPAAEAILLEVTSTNATRLWRAKRRAEWSNLNLLDGIPKVNGSATLQVRAQAQFQTALYAATSPPAGPLNFLGVSCMTANKSNSPAPQIDAWQKRDGALPLVTAGQAVIFADADLARRLALAPEFDPVRTVVLSPEAREPLGANTNAASITVTSRKAAAHRVEVAIDAAAAGPVVVAQSYYPAWKATIDGKAVPVHLANGAFQAVLAPAGKHAVVFEYKDRAFTNGLIVSGISVLAWLALLLPRRRVAAS